MRGRPEVMFVRGRAAERLAGIVLLSVALAVAPATGAGLSLEPATACSLLDDQGIRTRDGYREAGRGLFRCASTEQRWPPGNPTADTVRYAATGDRGRVRQLELEVSLHSRGDLRPVLQAFARLADTLASAALDRPLPLEAHRALRIGTPGTWEIDGTQVALERITGAEPALRFVIR